MPRSFSIQPSHPNIYLPDGWDAGWRAAKASAASAPLQLNIIGDSISIGYNSSWAGAFTTQLVAKLQASYGHFGDYYANIQAYGGPSTTPGWAAGSGITPYYDGFGNSVYSATTAAAVDTFTAPYPCTAFDFIWYDDSSYHGAWSYSLDGGATVLATGPNDNALHRIPFTGLANTSHTFTWGWQASNANCMAQGACTYVPGATTGLFAARFDGQGALVGYIAAPGFTETTFHGYPAGGHLTIFELGANDINAGATTIATFASILDQTIRSLRRAYHNASIAFVITSYPNPLSDDVNSGFTNAANAYQYHDAIYQAARRHACAVFDVHARWGPTPYAQGFMNNNNIHPIAAGQADIFTFISPYIY